MFDELNKYKENDHFFFTHSQNLQDACNAPTTKSGVYLVYALKKGKVELVYIGRSGKLKNDGSMFIRKANLGGIKDRIVNGHQFGKVARKKSWPLQMIKQQIEAIDVYWYITHAEEYVDCPRVLENNLLKKHYSIYGYLPKWNNEF
jgi:hypothetical protein